MEAPANSRVSRWSDAPLSSQPSAAQDSENGEKRPSSTAPEPPFKKSRMDLGQTQGGSATAGHAGDTASGSIGPAEGLTNSKPSFAGVVGYGGSSPADQACAAFPAYGAERNYAPGSARGSGTGALFFKTKLCTKFKLGTCTFNDRCHFAHGVEELRKPPAGWEDMVKQGGLPFSAGASGHSSETPRRSTKPCRFYLEGHCPYGERCTFSHGNDDVHRDTAPSMDHSLAAGALGRSNYKTRLCSRWEKGELCVYGDKCHFAHGQAELQAYPRDSNYTSSGGTGPSVYNVPRTVNPPPMAGPYGVSATYGSASIPPPASSTNLNPYPVVGASSSMYGAQPDGSNGYPANYVYWNQENKWDGSDQAVPAPTTTLSTQGYGQPNETSWMPNYSVDGGYPKINSNQAPYDNQEMSQQQIPPVPQQQQPQPQPQPQQQQHMVSYYGSVPTYQDPNQAVNPPYMQNVVQNGDGMTYYDPNFANQQQGHIGNPQQVYMSSQQQGYTGSYNAV